VGQLVVSHGNDNHHLVQRHTGGSLVIPAAAAVLTSPVLDVTVLEAGSVLSLNVAQRVSGVGVGDLVAVHANGIASIEVLVVNHGQLNSHQVGVLSASLIQPSLAADVAVPVSNVAQLGAGSILSLDSYNVVLDLAGLAAQVAIHVASVVVLVLARGLGILAVDVDGRLLNVNNSDRSKAHGEVVVGVVLDGQVIVAGIGIVLDFEDNGEVLFLGDVSSGSTISVLHGASAVRTISEGTLPLSGRLDIGIENAFLPLTGDFQRIGVK